MKTLALAILLTACGGTTIESPASPDDAFVQAVCSHTACPNWPEQQVCEYSYHAAMERLGPQDEACIADATAVVKEPGCGAEVQTVANDVVMGKCTEK